MLVIGSKSHASPSLCTPPNGVVYGLSCWKRSMHILLTNQQGNPLPIFFFFQLKEIMLYTKQQGNNYKASRPKKEKKCMLSTIAIFSPAFEGSLPFWLAHSAHKAKFILYVHPSRVAYGLSYSGLVAASSYTFLLASWFL